MFARTRKHALCLTLPLLLVALMPLRVGAWGGTGHRIVAIIAEGRLTTRARREVRRLLGNNVSLSSVATFADDIRNSRPDTRQFHFVDIPLEEDSFDPARDCPPSAQGDCVLAALERFRAELADTSQSNARRAFALKFIVHLVGDMHQPLHCAENNNDRGGNNVKIFWFGSSNGGQLNLHSLWDSIIINGTGLNDAQFARELERGLTKGEATAFQDGTPLDWALEAHRAAQTVTYGALPKEANGEFVERPRLGAVYLRKARPVIDDQLTKGGVRLAKILNDTLR
jgi:hypothetical protein